MDGIPIGFFGKPHGIRGEIHFFPSGDLFPQLKLPCSLSIVTRDKTKRSLTIYEARKTVSSYLLKLLDFEIREDLAQFQGSQAFVDKALLTEIPLQDSEILVHDLIGLRAKEILSQTLLDYSVVEVKDNPVHSILVFQDFSRNQEILVPFHNEFVGDWNLQEKTIEVKRWEDWFAV